MTARSVLLLLAALLASVTAAAQTDPVIIPGPDDAIIYSALAATVTGDTLTFEQMDAVSELLSLSHDELMARALAHVEAGQPGRAEIDLTLVQAGADTSPAASYAQLSVLAYAQLLQGRNNHATASLIFASGSYDELDRPFHPAIPREAAMRLASGYIDVARGAPEADRARLGRQAAVWWARAGADDHLSQLSARGPDERLIVAWAHAQIGRIDLATVELAQARLAFRARLKEDFRDADAHEGLAHSYDVLFTGVAASANADSASIHAEVARELRAGDAPEPLMAP